MKTLYYNFNWWEAGEPQRMIVEDGRVRNRGPVADDVVEADENIDLQGKTLYPAFVDNHCHILPTGLDLQKLHLGACTSNQDVLDLLSSEIRSVRPDRWLLAVHYDQNKFGGEFITKSELDSVSTSVPILLRHVNGHASITNTTALRLARIADDEPDPDGGSYRRGPDGNIDGVLLENAHERVSRAVPNATLREMVDAILLAGKKMAELGICCASDMMTGRFNLEQELQAYQIAAQRNCAIQTRLYLQYSEVFDRSGNQKPLNLPNTRGCRVAGIKIFADGAIGSATAAIYGHYSGATTAGHRISRRATLASETSELEVSGQLIYPRDRLNEMVRIAHEAGYQVAIHTIGDYSTDLVMDAYEQVDEPQRHRIEHAMILSDAQIERMAKLGCYCSMQPEFLTRFGNTYHAQLGSVRAAKLNRYRSVKDAGIPLSLSSDRPIVSGDPVIGIQSASERPQGYDASENLTYREAVLAYSAEGAKVTGDNFGSLEPGDPAIFAAR
ncbi:MAG TPA: amidohydrolase [Fimbriimonadaceae bacterium]|nr:amidohydrolase [Fimbriimonadaceae bacterium]